MDVSIIGGADGPTSIFLANPVESFFFGGGFTSVFFLLVAVVVGVIVWTLVKSAAQGVKNSASPRVEVRARVVTKRTHVWGDHARTGYYVTFEMEGGERLELQLSGEDYGMLAEGDRGCLTHQGTRFLGFDRMTEV